MTADAPTKRGKPRRATKARGAGASGRALSENAPPRYYKRLGAILAQLRRDHDMRQADVEKATGIKQGRLSRWEAGERQVPVWALERLAAVYQTTVNAVLRQV